MLGIVPPWVCGLYTTRVYMPYTTPGTPSLLPPHPRRVPHSRAEPAYRARACTSRTDFQARVTYRLTTRFTVGQPSTRFTVGRLLSDQAALGPGCDRTVQQRCPECVPFHHPFHCWSVLNVSRSDLTIGLYPPVSHLPDIPDIPGM